MCSCSIGHRNFILEFIKGENSNSMAEEYINFLNKEH